jgi:plastocyanin
MRRPAVAVVLAALAASVLAGCVGGGDDASAAAATPGTVVVKNLKYGPKTITVDAGERVTWKFADGRIPHDVKGDGWKSPTQSKGAWTHTFTEAGSYDYHCTLHPYMKGTVEVRG